jgi:hypothetical protein
MNAMEKSPHTPYVIILLGLLLFGSGMVIDLIEHGKDFLIGEFRESPLAHILPALGIAIVLVGTIIGWRRIIK